MKPPRLHKLVVNPRATRDEKDDAAYSGTHGIPVVERTVNAIQRTQRLRRLHGVKRWMGKRRTHRDYTGKVEGHSTGTQGGRGGIVNSGEQGD